MNLAMSLFQCTYNIRYTFILWRWFFGCLQQSIELRRCDFNSVGDYEVIKSPKIFLYRTKHSLYIQTSKLDKHRTDGHHVIPTRKSQPFQTVDQKWRLYQFPIYSAYRMIDARRCANGIGLPGVRFSNKLSGCPLHLVQNRASEVWFCATATTRGLCGVIQIIYFKWFIPCFRASAWSELLMQSDSTYDKHWNFNWRWLARL
jgi:hypothetical protein